MSKEAKKSKSSKHLPAQEVGEPKPLPPLRSFCDVAGPWETKKISIFGAVRSVISQLRLNDETDPLKRFLLVLRWYLACYCEIKFNHKPYNPVINESHQCTVTSPEGSKATFVAEQVSHHPPLSAIHISNPEKNLTIVGNITFAIKFGGNSASCESKGDARITVNNETYIISKGMPDVLLTNVVIGTRVNTWNGEVEVSCPQTGYRATLKLAPKDSRSHVDGHIYHEVPNPEDPSSSATSASSSTAPHPHGHGCHGDEKTEKQELILVFKGHWADEALYAEPMKPKKEKTGLLGSFWGSKKDKEDKKKVPEQVGEPVKHLVIDITAVNKATLVLPAENEIEDTDSLKIWRDVSLAITGDDLATADIAKNKVEAAQRSRMKAGAQEGDERRFFTYCKETQLWKWNGKLYTGGNFLGETDELTQSATLGTSTLDGSEVASDLSASS